jgi:phosphoserine phosphatase
VVVRIRTAALAALLLQLVVAPAVRAQKRGPRQASFAPDVARRIDQAIAAHRGAPGRKVAVFDLDNTLIFNDIGHASFYALLDSGIPCKARSGLDRGLPASLRRRCRAARGARRKSALISRIAAYYRKLCKTRGQASCRGWLALLFAGMSPGQLSAFAKRVVARELATPLCRQPGKGVTRWRGARIYEAQRRLIATLNRQGFEVWLVSASVEPLARALAPHLGVSPKRAIGVRLAQRRGRYQAQLLGPVPCRSGKLIAVRKRIGVRPLLVFGHALADLELLSYAKTLAVVIDRAAHPALLRRAKRGGWPLQPPFIAPKRIPRCR